MTNSDLFVSAAYVLYVVAPAIRDELWLRTALFINSLGFATWGLWIGSWPVVIANALFCFMSLRQMHRAWEEKQPADLDEDAATIGAQLFPQMSGRDLERLWNLGTEIDSANIELTSLGQELDSLYVVMEGDVEIQLADGTLVVRSAPTVVGEVTTLSPQINGATATVRVSDARVWKWSKAELTELQAAHPSMTAPFVQGLSTQMADRILRTPVATEDLDLAQTA